MLATAALEGVEGAVEPELPELLELLEPELEGAGAEGAGAEGAAARLGLGCELEGAGFDRGAGRA